MTFRARLATNSTVESGEMDILLCRRSALVDFKRDKITLTKEWQTFTFDATNGGFEDTMIQFFVPFTESYSYLLDDVKIEHEINSIEAPKASLATDITNDSFVANWEATADADKYLLSVYEKVPDGEAEVRNEGFESLNVNADGKTLNAENPGFPEGWNISLSSGSKQEVYTDKEFVGAGSKAICLDDDNDYIETPASDKPIKKFTVWMKADTRDQVGQINSSLNLMGYTLATGWVNWAGTAIWNIADLYPDGVVNDYSNLVGALDNMSQVRIQLNKKDNVNLAIDNIMIEYVGETKPVYLFKDKELAKDVVSYKVEGDGFNTDADYFYTVKAQNETFTSANSKEIEVYMAHTPTALPATNVTEHGYTANWECGSKADYFKVEQSLTFTAEEDMPNYTVLEEDFSKIKSNGTVEKPEVGEYTLGYMPLDKYTKISGWEGSSYGFADGMVGGLAYTEPYTAGVIRTPKIDLSHNEGVFDVTIRVYLGSADSFVISSGGGFMDFTALEEPGWIEKTTTMQFGKEGDQLMFYAYGYAPFMIDYVKISQTIKAGDKSSIVTNSKDTDNAKARSLDFDNVDFVKGRQISYIVKSYRNYHGNEEDVWVSNPSNTIIVNQGDGGVSENISRSSFLAAGVEGGILVVLDKNADVEVFAVDGTLVKAEKGFVGENRLSIDNAGVYIVRVNGETVKVLVR